jgi:general secretion pathway protein E
MAQDPLAASGAPIPVDGDAVVILDQIVRLAAQYGASDIHLEPKDTLMQVRFRVDGALLMQRPLAVAVATQILSRIKVLARMDIAERRLPQDGQFSLDLGMPTKLHLRASTFPSMWGEKIVLRLLLAQSLIPFDSLGFEGDICAIVRAIVQRPQGFVLACGPTGSGKTSTLYSFLQLLDTTRVNVVTLEDPVEVEVASITQGQANPRAGFTFEAGLRAVLRQDPDVILVGEVRDSQTAAIALQAALTGHMVFSTLHTSDTVETIVRLVDLGIEPWIIANSISAVVAQRLVRRVCAHCRAKASLEIDVWDGDEVLLMQGSEIVRPRGCERCHGSGYRGRTGIFEVLEFDDELRELIKRKSTAPAYRSILRKRQVASLRKTGLRKVQQGVTSVDEVLRVTL